MIWPVYWTSCFWRLILFDSKGYPISKDLPPLRSLHYLHPPTYRRARSPGWPPLYEAMIRNWKQEDRTTRYSSFAWNTPDPEAPIPITHRFTPNGTVTCKVQLARIMVFFTSTACKDLTYLLCTAQHYSKCSYEHNLPGNKDTNNSPWTIQGSSMNAEVWMCPVAPSAALLYTPC